MYHKISLYIQQSAKKFKPSQQQNHEHKFTKVFFLFPMNPKLSIQDQLLQSAIKHVATSVGMKRDRN